MGGSLAGLPRQRYGVKVLGFPRRRHRFRDSATPLATRCLIVVGLFASAGAGDHERPGAQVCEDAGALRAHPADRRQVRLQARTE
eukprot:3417775-Pyramimonas_sp.AAC.1